jgi:hypothetical protein
LLQSCIDAVSVSLMRFRSVFMMFSGCMLYFHILSMITYDLKCNSSQETYSRCDTLDLCVCVCVCVCV